MGIGWNQEGPNDTFLWKKWAQEEEMGSISSRKISIQGRR